MVTLLVWCLMLIDSFFPRVGELQMTSPPDAVLLAELARGRLLVGRVGKGMTTEQVEKILGRPESGFLMGWNCSRRNHRGGVGVSYYDGKVSSAGVYRFVMK
jgi:hypothetical protein